MGAERFSREIEVAVWTLEVPARDSIRITGARRVTTGAQTIETATVPGGRLDWWPPLVERKSDIWVAEIREE